MKNTMIPDTLHAHEWAVDKRHADVLALACRLLSPLHVVEIGAFQGASTRVFVEAVDLGYVTKLDVIEPRPTDELLSILDARDGRVYLWPFRSDEKSVRALRPTMVFIDGDHGQPAVDEMMHYLGLSTPIIAMHDTHSADEGWPACWGSRAAFKSLMRHAEWEVVYDHKRRSGERTHRGLAVAVRKDYPGWEEACAKLANEMAR